MVTLLIIGVCLCFVSGIIGLVTCLASYNITDNVTMIVSICFLFFLAGGVCTFISSIYLICKLLGLH